MSSSTAMSITTWIAQQFLDAIVRRVFDNILEAAVKHSAQLPWAHIPPGILHLDMTTILQICSTVRAAIQVAGHFIG